MLCPYRFSNQLPDIPSDPKLLVHHFDKEALVRYRYDSVIESGHRYELLAEPDLGIHIDLVDPHAYDAPPDAEIDPDDMELLVTAASTEGGAGSVRKPHKQLRENVTWLRKTPLMGNNLYEAVNNHAKERIETQHVARESRELALSGGHERRSLAELVDSIEKGFDAAAALKPGQVTHPTDSSLVAEAVLPVLPDFECWHNQYVQMQFDVDPALEQASDLEPKYARDRVARALVKGSSTQPRDGVPATQYVAYLLPKDKKAAGGEGDEEAERETEAEAAQAEAEDEEAGVARTELEWVREYAYEVIRQEEGAAYFFVMGSESVVYNECASRISLTRKALCEVSARPSEVVLKRRALEEHEQAEHDTRRQKLAADMLRLTHRADDD